MPVSRLVLGGWLIAAPFFCVADPAKTLLRWELKETPAEVAKFYGAPAEVGEAGSAHFSWFLHLDQQDHHDPSHILLFEREAKTLVSVTQNFDTPTDVDELFPDAESRSYYWKEGNHAPWPTRVRLLPGGRVLVAMGVAKAGERTTQLLLIRGSALGGYLPWLAEQIARD